MRGQETAKNFKSGCTRLVLAPITRIFGAAHPGTEEIACNVGLRSISVEYRKTLGL